MGKINKMNITETITSFFRGHQSKGETPSYNSKVQEALLRFVTGSVTNGPESAKQILEQAYMGNPDVYAVVDRIAKNAARVKWKLYEEDKEGNREEVRDHQLLDIWSQPNPNSTGYELRHGYITNYLATGNGIINGVGPGTGSNPLESNPNKDLFLNMYLVPIDHTTIKTGGWQDPVAGYIIDTAQDIVIPKSEMLHIKTYNPDFANGAQFWGMSPIRAAARVVRSSNDAFTAKSVAFQNHGIRGFISSKEDGYTQEQAQIVEKKLMQKGGAENYGRIASVNSDIKWNAIGMTLDELGLVDSILGDLRKICAVFDVDSKLFNDPGATTYNNMIEAQKHMWENVVIPINSNFADGINRWLVEPFGRRDKKKYCLEPDYSEVSSLKKDLKTVKESYDGVWQVSPNEVREAFGKPKLDDTRLDALYVPAGLIPFDDLFRDFTAEELESEKFLKALKINDYE